MTPADAIDVLVENPFDVAAERLATAVATMSRRAVVEGALRAAIDRGPAQAERALLATAHAFAITAPSKQLLGSDLLPASLARSLPHARADYVAVGAAAGRCLRALGALRGTSSAMAAVRRASWAACFGDSLVHALVLAPVIHDHDVLIVGETGTGKEGVARAIQEGCIGGKDGGPAPRAALNVAAIPESLVAAELFGHVKGAFTGAVESRAGQIRSAAGGSLFLDEIGDLALTTQVKLLRVMETNDVTPLGSDRHYRASCRYVAATHKDLAAMVENGTFRRDLHQRLAGMVITLPPLRDRPEDIRDIGEAFVERHLPHEALGATRKRIRSWLGSSEAMRHRWPGNVRELENALRSLLLGLDAGIEPRDDVAIEPRASGELPPRVRDSTATLEEVARWYVRRVVDASEGNVAHAARTLAVDRNTVRRRLQARPARG